MRKLLLSSILTVSVAFASAAGAIVWGSVAGIDTVIWGS
jgi:hypothetical protein